jgi:hypothetical protein
MFEEPASSHTIDEFVPFPVTPGGENFTNLGLAGIDGRLIAIVGGGERREVMFAFQQRSGRVERLLIHRVGVVVNKPAFNWRADFRSPDPILVSFSDGVEAGMKIRVHLFHLHDSDIFRQKPVDRFPQVVAWNRIFECESGYLGDGVDSSVGPAGPRHVHRSFLNPAYDVLEHLLDCWKSRLDLPSFICGPVVGYKYADATARH